MFFGNQHSFVFNKRNPGPQNRKYSDKYDRIKINYLIKGDIHVTISIGDGVARRAGGGRGRAIRGEIQVDKLCHSDGCMVEISRAHRCQEHRKLYRPKFYRFVFQFHSHDQGVKSSPNTCK